MKEYLVSPKALIPDDPDAGQGFPEHKEGDFATIGRAAMSGDSDMVRLHIIKPAGKTVIKGAEVERAGGLILNLFPPLTAYITGSGKEFAFFSNDPAEVTLEAAHATLARIDLIYARLHEDVDGGAETRRFKKDPTNISSFEGDAEAFFLKQNVITIEVVTGTPSAQPTVPEIPNGQIGAPMYQIMVDANATAINDSGIIDVRHNFRTLEECSEAIDLLITQVNNQGANKHRHPADQIDVAAPGSKLGVTAQDIFDYLAGKTDESSVDLIVRPEILRPDIAPNAEQSGKLGSVGAGDGATPCIDIPYGRAVDFYGSERKRIEPSGFPTAVNAVSVDARIVNKHAAQATESRSQSTPLSLSAIDSIQTDGGGTFSLQTPALAGEHAASYAGSRMTAARDSRYIEIMGGAGDQGADGSWVTYDTQTGDLTPRAFTGDVITWFIRGIFSMGNGIHVLVCAQPGATCGINGGKLFWYKVNCVTGASVKLTGTAPGYTEEDVASSGCNASGAIGDLIDTNLIFLAVIAPGVIAGVSYWFYHVDTNSFEQITNFIGANPLTGLELNTQLKDVGCCIYQQGKAIILRGNGIQTHIFDAGTRTFTKLSINNPKTRDDAWTGTLWGCSLGNLDGRVYLSSETSNLWELTPAAIPTWEDLGLPEGYGGISYLGGRTFGNPAQSGRGFTGIAGLLSAGLPKGPGYIIGGRVSNAPKKDIWQFQAGGVIEVLCNGVQGLSLSPGATVVTFRLNDGYTLPWKVSKVLSNPVGNFTGGSIEIRYSFDGGVSTQTVPRDVATTVLNTAGQPAQPQRSVYITLRGTANNRPCISKLNEVFEQLGGSSGLAEVVLRANVPTNAEYGFYMKRDGSVTIEAVTRETTPGECLLLKSIPAVSNPATSAPTAFDFVNKRLIHRKYIGTRASGATPSIANDLPCRPSYVRAVMVDTGGSAGILKDLADPSTQGEAAGVILFNQPIVVAGLGTNGQSYNVELEA